MIYYFQIALNFPIGFSCISLASIFGIDEVKLNCAFNFFGRVLAGDALFRFNTGRTYARFWYRLFYEC